jgi:glycosyltransferase involved in cell wall biosynthesis
LRARSGHESYVRAHARAARQVGFDPHLFFAGPSEVTTASHLGVMHQVRTRPWNLRNLNAPIHTPPLVRALGRATEGGRGPVLVHGFGLWAYAAVIAVGALRRRGVSAVSVAGLYTAHEQEVRAKMQATPLHRGLGPWLAHREEYAWLKIAVNRCERRICAEADRVLVNYDSVARSLRARYPLDDRLRKVAYTSETAFSDGFSTAVTACPPGIASLSPKDAPLLVVVSRHAGNKGIDTCLAALARLERQGVGFRACLVGGGRLLENHRRLALRLGLSRRVVLTGEVRDVAPYLLAADVFVLPSVQEGSGSVSLIEALQAGLPAVASDLDGIPEDLEHERSALLAAPGDASSLAVAMARVLSDRGLRKRLARRSREVFERRFSPAAMAEDLSRVYQELGVGPAPPPSTRWYRATTSPSGADGRVDDNGLRRSHPVGS